MSSIIGIQTQAGFSLAFLVLTVALSCGCSTMTRKRLDEETSKVKKAAVAAYVVKAPASRAIGMDVNTGGMAGMAGGSSFYQKSEHAVQMLNDFSSTLAKQTRWDIKPIQMSVRDSVYAHQTKQTMAVAQLRDLPPAGQNWYLVDNMMVPSAFQYLDRNQRNQLMAAMGVDALVTVEVSIENEGKFMGLGPHYPQSSMTMKVFKRDHSEPIWIEWIEGEKSKTSTGITAFMDENELLKLARESAQTAFKRIGTEIK